MNEAVKTMSDLLSGEYRKTIVVGGKIFVMRAPSIKVIVRATRHFSCVEILRDVSVNELLTIVSAQAAPIVKGLSYLVAGDVPDFEERASLLADDLGHGTHEELCSAFLVAFNLITGKELFLYASLAMELANLIVRPR